MIDSKIFTGVILIVFGAVSLIRPAAVISLRVWIAKKLYGAEYKPSAKTIFIQKILGVLFLILGVLALNT